VSAVALPSSGFSAEKKENIENELDDLAFPATGQRSRTAVRTRSRSRRNQI
jgi:hypothetical protein